MSNATANHHQIWSTKLKLMVHFHFTFLASSVSYKETEVDYQFKLFCSRCLDYTVLLVVFRRDLILLLCNWKILYIQFTEINYSTSTQSKIKLKQCYQHRTGKFNKKTDVGGQKSFICIFS